MKIADLSCTIGKNEVVSLPSSSSPTVVWVGFSKERLRVAVSIRPLGTWEREPEMPMHQKHLMMVLTLRWARRPGELENGFEVTFLCLLPIARTPHIHWLDTCGNNSTLLDPFDNPCNMVLETLVSFHFFLSIFFLSILLHFPSFLSINIISL